ncbi:MAG: TetR-like C-terminal domain-containing protein, partial [Ktedonobacterales bacterium]
IRAMATLYRDYIKMHPGLYAATSMTSVTFDTPELDTAREELYAIVMRAMSAYHLAPDDEIHAIRIFRILVHGTATLELGQGFGLPQDIDETFERLLTIYLRELTQASGDSMKA